MGLDSVVTLALGLGTGGTAERGLRPGPGPCVSSMASCGPKGHMQVCSTTPAGAPDSRVRAKAQGLWGGRERLARAGRVRGLPFQYLLSGLSRPSDHTAPPQAAPSTSHQAASLSSKIRERPAHHRGPGPAPGGGLLPPGRRPRERQGNPAGSCSKACVRPGRRRRQQGHGLATRAVPRQAPQPPRGTGGTPGARGESLSCGRRLAALCTAEVSSEGDSPLLLPLPPEAGDPEAGPSAMPRGPRERQAPERAEGSATADPQSHAKAASTWKSRSPVLEHAERGVLICARDIPTSTHHRLAARSQPPCPECPAAVVTGRAQAPWRGAEATGQAGGGYSDSRGKGESRRGRRGRRRPEPLLHRQGRRRVAWGLGVGRGGRIKDDVRASGRLGLWAVPCPPAC